MTFEQLLSLAQTWPVIESKNLVACGHEPRALAVQLSRWVELGRLMRLRRGLYLLRPPYQRIRPARAYVANLLSRPSFVSFESGLAFHGMIPEETPLLQSVTTGRPRAFVTDLGDFSYRHVAPTRFFGYREYPTEVGSALIATPERALLDLLYFAKGPFDEARVRELRLQNLESVDLDRLESQARRFASSRLLAATTLVRRYAQQEQQDLEAL